LKLVYIFSVFLVIGMIFSQIIDLQPIRDYLTLLTEVFLSYILMEVGLELTLNKSNWKSYLFDYAVAFTAAAFPWLFCFIYFLFSTDQSWQELLVISRFSAPTASGILFSMLAAAGLGMTWFFKKVQILAILDDIDTIVLMIPLQILISGMRYELFYVLIVIGLLILISWKYLHTLKLPVGKLWLLGYSITLTLLLHLIYQNMYVKFEILLPAFVFGSVLVNPHDSKKLHINNHEHQFIEPQTKVYLFLDRFIKIFFMLLVGMLMPKIDLMEMNFMTLAVDVLLITFLSNLGKCFPMLCYKKEATLKERIALGFGLCPRGEVGAGILLLAIQKGAGGYATTVAGLSLALNLLLTGLIVLIAIKLVKDKKQPTF
jgi:Kef-type K+ transport system membrane component KefB